MSVKSIAMVLLVVLSSISTSLYADLIVRSKSEMFFDGFWGFYEKASWFLILIGVVILFLLWRYMKKK